MRFAWASGSLRSMWGSGHKRTSPKFHQIPGDKPEISHVLLGFSKKTPLKLVGFLFSPFEYTCWCDVFSIFGWPDVDIGFGQPAVTRHERVDSGLRNHGPGRGELGLEAVCFSSKSRELLSEFEGTRIVQVSKWLDFFGGGWVGGSK